MVRPGRPFCFQTTLVLGPYSGGDSGLRYYEDCCSRVRSISLLLVVLSCLVQAKACDAIKPTKLTDLLCRDVSTCPAIGRIDPCSG